NGFSCARVISRLLPGKRDGVFPNRIRGDLAPGEVLCYLAAFAGKRAVITLVHPQNFQRAIRHRVHVSDRNQKLSGAGIQNVSGARHIVGDRRNTAGELLEYRETESFNVTWKNSHRADTDPW